jgi:hypothetical protein
MKTSLSVILVLFTLFSARCQIVLHGKVIDAKTKESLPFVNIIVSGTTTGTSTGIDGRFSIEAKRNSILSFSYVGFEGFSLSVNSDTPNFLVIAMNQSSQQLEAVEVFAGENPAFEIIRRVLKNRAKNDPENLESFSYKAYHKLYATADGTFDSLALTKSGGKFLSKHHLFLNESFTERKFVKPSYDKEIIIGNRMSGVKDPFFAVVTTSFQPFTFYKDHINLLDKNYINPISPGTFDRYNFDIADTIVHETDSTFLISFQPLEGKKFEGLKGVLYVNTNGYALEHVLAEPSDPKVLLQVKVQQKYQFIDGTWFPEQLNTELILKDYKILDRPIKYVHRSYITESKINPLLAKKDFGLLNVEFTKLANRQSEDFWITSRLDSLSIKERNTYHLYDTLKKSELATLNSIVKAGEAFAVGKFKVGKFYLPIASLIRINEYEAYRFGFGLQTNEDVSENVSLEGYAAYGVQDKGFKYGGGIQFNLSRIHDIFLKVNYSQDVVEPGNANYIKPPPLLAGPQRFRDWLTSRMDSVQEIKAQLYFRPLRFTQASIFLQQQRHNPTYKVDDVSTLNDYTLTEVGFQLRFSQGEKFAQIGNSKVVTALDYPQFNLAINQSMDNLLDGEFAFTKIEFSFEQQFLIRAFGKTNFQLASGWINGEAPYFSLFNGKGSNISSFSYNSFLIQNYFQTMGVYEFTSDRYAYLFFTHNFGRIVGTRSAYFRPELSIVHNSGIGTLSEKNFTGTSSLKSMEKGYFESGLILNNLLRIKYLNVAYVGLGAGAFVRYGEYARADFSDNVVYKISLMFGF